MTTWANIHSKYLQAWNGNGIGKYVNKKIAWLSQAIALHILLMMSVLYVYYNSNWVRRDKVVVDFHILVNIYGVK